MDLPSWLMDLMQDAVQLSLSEDIHVTWDDSALVRLGREDLRGMASASHTVGRSRPDEAWELG